MKGHIFFIMWVSGAGKGTLIHTLKEQKSELFFTPLSYKTRPKRAGEVDGVDAFFLSKEAFLASIEKGEFLEYAIVHDQDLYGTKLKDVLEFGIEQGKNIVKEIDILWLEKLKKERPELEGYYTTIFLSIPHHLLQKRVRERDRTISPEEVEQRLKSALYEQKKASEICDVLIDGAFPKEEVYQRVLEVMMEKIA